MGQTEPPLPAVPAAPLPQLEEVQEELLVEEEAVPGEQRAETLESPTMERRRRAAQAEEELGWSVPAFAVRRSSTGALSREPVLLFFGIIDFLQPYNARKRVERAFKVSMHGSGVSVADPKQYAKRFLGFVGSVFVDEGKAHDVL